MVPRRDTDRKAGDNKTFQAHTKVIKYNYEQLVQREGGKYIYFGSTNLIYHCADSGRHSCRCGHFCLNYSIPLIADYKNSGMAEV